MAVAVGAVSAPEFYDRLATKYDELFSAPHRRLYDDLAWGFVQDLLPRPAGTVVDVGCGTGRWSARLVAMGHRVVGIEPAAGMARIAANRLSGPEFELIRERVEDARLE